MLKFAKLPKEMRENMCQMMVQTAKAYTGADSLKLHAKPPKPFCAALDPHCCVSKLGKGRGRLAMDVAIDEAVSVGLMYDSVVQYGWLKEGAGDGNWTSIEQLAVLQKLCCCSCVHAAIVGLGVDGSTLHGSTEAGIGGASDAVDCHMYALFELGRIGAGRITSTIFGGGGRRYWKRP